MTKSMPKSANAVSDTRESKKAPAPSKRPWVRPQVKTSRLFEANSLACGKNSPLTEECGVQNPQQS
jgi:hypothetical protein